VYCVMARGRSFHDFTRVVAVVNKLAWHRRPTRRLLLGAVLSLPKVRLKSHNRAFYIIKVI
jgi:hypothetical protein